MFYLLLNGQKSGPFEPADIRQMLDQGAIGNETLFWTDGMMNWEPVGSHSSRFQRAATDRHQVAYQLPQFPPDQQQYWQQPAPLQPYNQYGQLPSQFYGPPKSRLAYILLALFLGGLGVHNFYAGHTGRGVAQLLLTLLLFWTIIVPIGVWIWTIVEMITVDRDVNGQPMV